MRAQVVERGLEGVLVLSGTRTGVEVAGRLQKGRGASSELFVAIEVLQEFGAGR